MITFGTTPQRVRIPRGDEAHVWLAHFAVTPLRTIQFEAMLALEERARAARFHQPQDRQRYTTARACLRLLLGRYLQVPPEQIRFTANVFGKPRLETDPSGPDLRFNLSHSDELVLIGFALGRELGVDVERLRPEFATDEIAERFFSRGEVAALRALPREARQEAFFRCWTRKEAYLKARGDGLSFPLEQLEVSMGDSPAVLHAANDPHVSSRWEMWDLAMAPGYAAAVVVEGRDVALRCWRWPDEWFIRPALPLRRGFVSFRA
jgi:4'-phosphopantetheinyl transferase